MENLCNVVEKEKKDKKDVFIPMEDISMILDDNKPQPNNSLYDKFPNHNNNNINVKKSPILIINENKNQEDKLSDSFNEMLEELHK